MVTRIAVYSEMAEEGDALVAQLREAQYTAMHFSPSFSAPRDISAWKPKLVVYSCGTARGPKEGAFVRIRYALDVPILVLGPVQDENFIVRVLSMGADGCLCRPFGVQEFLARVEAHIRRYWDWESCNRDLGDEIYLDGETHSVIVGNREVHLSPTEYRLLTCLANHNGHVVTREELHHSIWGTGDVNGDSARVVSLYIYYLRKKLEADPRNPQFIRTKWGAGYYLCGKRHQV
jgi:DNA-binding response OmpR family regulator